MLSKINKRYTNLIIWVLMGGLRRIRKYPLSANQCAGIDSNDLLSVNFLAIAVSSLSDSNHKI